MSVSKDWERGKLTEVGLAKAGRTGSKLRFNSNEVEFGLDRRLMIEGACLCDYTDMGYKFKKLLSCPLSKRGDCLHKGEREAVK